MESSQPRPQIAPNQQGGNTVVNPMVRNIQPVQPQPVIQQNNNPLQPQQIPQPRPQIAQPVQNTPVQQNVPQIPQQRAPVQQAPQTQPQAPVVNNQAPRPAVQSPAQPVQNVQQPAAAEEPLGYDLSVLNADIESDLEDINRAPLDWSSIITLAVIGGVSLAIYIVFRILTAI